MTKEDRNSTSKSQSLVVLDLTGGHASGPERDLTGDVVQLLSKSGWTVDWHVDRNSDLRDIEQAAVWRTLDTVSLSENAADHRANAELGESGSGQTGFLNTKSSEISNRMMSRISAADEWARATWHAGDTGFPIRTVALSVWLVVRVFYLLQMTVGRALYAIRTVRRGVAKLLFGGAINSYPVESIGKKASNARWRLFSTVLRKGRRAADRFYYRIVLANLIEPGRKLVGRVYWKALYPLVIRARGLRASHHRIGAKQSRGTGSASNPGANARIEGDNLAAAGAISHHADLSRFAKWLKEREEAGTLPELVLMPHAKAEHLEAVLELVAELELDKPLPVTLVAIPTPWPAARAEPGTADVSTLSARLRSGSPFQRFAVLAAGQTAGKQIQWHGLPTINVDGMTDNKEIPSAEAIADFLGKVTKTDSNKCFSLVVETFGPLAIVSSALWGRVGSSAIFDSQVRVLIESGFRVARFYFDHWPVKGAERNQRIKIMIGQDQAKIRPHYQAVMERDERYAELKATTSKAAFRSASPLKRMSMLLANSTTETQKLVDWIGRTATIAVVNHAPHVDATRRLTNAPIILETHDIYSHLLDIHGVPGFVPVGPDGPTLRLSEERAIWSEVDCCVNLSAAEHLEITDFAQRSAHIQPIRDRSAPSDRPWLQIARENRLDPGQLSPGFFDIMLWGSWHGNNVRSIRWFLEEVTPKLEKYRKMRIAIVGKVLNGLRPYIRQFPNVVCFDYIDQLEDIALRSRVLVLPDLEGTGISIKAMDALAWGACFSSTKHGMRGVMLGDFNPPLAETADELAADILGLLEKLPRRQERRALAEQLFDLNYSNDKYFDAWKHILRDVAPVTATASAHVHRLENATVADGHTKGERQFTQNTNKRGRGKPQAQLSVVVTTGGSYEKLPDTIRSLARQNVPPGVLEVIVVDNAPDQDLAAKVAERYADIAWLKYVLEPSPGNHIARNAGLAAAQAQIVSFIDDDMIADRNWASKILETIQATNGKIGIAGGPVLPLWIAPQPAWLKGDLLKYLSISDLTDPYGERQSESWMAGRNIAFDKSALQSVGGFSRTLGELLQDQTVGPHAETKVVNQLRQLGYEAVYAAEAVMKRVADPEPLEPQWFRSRAAWQAVSDFIMFPDDATSSVKLVGEHLRTIHNNRDPAFPLHSFRITEFGEQVQHDVNLIYDLVSVMLVGGIEEDDVENLENHATEPKSLPVLSEPSERRNSHVPKNAKPRLSVVIATYERYDLLPYALASLRAQTVAAEEIQIIVVDNSPDKKNALAFAQRYDGDAQISYVVAEQSGLSNARNIGLEMALADHVAYIDDDAIAEPEWAANILDAFTSLGNRAAIVGGRVKPRWLSERPNWLADHLLSYLSIIDWGDNPHEVKDTEWLVGCNMAFDKAALVSAGGFSTELGRIGSGAVLLSNEDNDVIEKMTSAGQLAIYTPEAEVEHLIDPQRLKRSWFRRRAAWQAVSDFVQDKKRINAYVPKAQQHVRQVHGNESPGATGFFSATSDPERFVLEVGYCYDVVVSLLAGGEGLDSTGKPVNLPSVRSRIRGRLRQAVLANKQLARLAKKIPYRFR